MVVNFHSLELLGTSPIPIVPLLFSFLLGQNSVVLEAVKQLTFLLNFLAVGLVSHRLDVLDAVCALQLLGRALVENSSAVVWDRSTYRRLLVLGRQVLVNHR